MTDGEILHIALEQSAIDCGCSASDFLSPANTVVVSRADPRARRYLELPFDCDLTCYGNGIVASVAGPLTEPVRGYIDRYPAEHCFETPNLLVLADLLAPFGLRVCFMAEYFLPRADLRPLSCGLATRFLTPSDFAGLYLPQWSNALCEKRRELDVLAVGAYDGDTLVGLAGCSADCEGMWQIGIDVLPAYRRTGIASALTSMLAFRVLELGTIPFYCCAWSNVKSARNAIRSGFRPAWVQLTAKPEAFVRAMNENLT